jgi:multiple sugar transport system permease protein
MAMENIQVLPQSQNLRQQKRAKQFRDSLVYHVGVGVLGILMLYPILWLISSSLKPADQIWTTVYDLVPAEIKLENYVNGWEGFGGITFTTFYRNSFVYTILSTVFTVVSSAVVAFGFARIQFRGKRIWFSVMLLTLMLPDQVLIIPQYIVFSQLDWLNTFLPLLIPKLGGSVFFIFMIIQFIRGIPIDLDEAAMIDGASQFGVFYHVILPQLKPAVITAAIFSFYWTWDDFFGPLIYLTNPNLYTVSVALRNFSDTTSLTDWGAVFAMLTLSLVPVFVIFVFFQRYLVEGIATTGLKG